MLLQWKNVTIQSEYLLKVSRVCELHAEVRSAGKDLQNFYKNFTIVFKAKIST